MSFVIFRKKEHPCSVVLHGCSLFILPLLFFNSFYDGTITIPPTCIFIFFHTLLWNVNGTERCPIKRIIAQYCWRRGCLYHNGGQATAFIESLITDTCHAVANSDSCQAVAFSESIIPNWCHAVGKGDGGQSAATRESGLADARHAVGNNCFWTPNNQCVGGCFNNGIAIITGIIYLITTFNFDGGQTTTARVFANPFISATCMLNGRKVMTQIL